MVEKDLIKDVVSDLVIDFIYYDRKEDGELSYFELHEAFRKNITVDYVVNCFKNELEKKLKEVHS